MHPVKPKKHLGQHFLTDMEIASRIASSLQFHERCRSVLEIGPGTGILTEQLIQIPGINFKAVEIDPESLKHLVKKFPDHASKFILGDFLQMDFKVFGSSPFCIIGNFPYNISTEILFRIYEYRDQVPEVVGMFQREVAQRIASPPGNRQYGIPSVLLQAFYRVEYLFTVDENKFHPSPSVKSAVIRLARIKGRQLGCDENKFRLVVKTAFNQRRKTLRNALKPLLKNGLENDIPFAAMRAEQLGVDDFVKLTSYFFPG